MRSPHRPAARRLSTTLATVALVASVLVGLGAAPAAGADFVVNSTADLPLGEVSCPGSPCTLRGAVQAANDAGGGGPHTITLGAGTHALTLTGADEDANATGDLDVYVPLQITGAGPGATIVDADGLGDRIFDLHAGGAFTLQGVHLTGGTAPAGGDGGAIQSATATIAITNSTLSANSAGDDGGAIDTSGGSTLTITNSTLTANSSNANGGAIDMGSGSTLTITNSTLTANSTEGKGGVVALNSNGVVTIAGSTLDDNFARRDSGAVQLNSQAVLTIADSSLSDNTTGGDGGALTTSFNTTITIVRSTLAGNTSGADGGAIETSSENTITITASTLSGNTASRHGGAIDATSGSSVTLNNSTVSGNVAGARGGAVLLSTDSSFEALHATVVGNVAAAEQSAGGLDAISTSLTNSIVANNIGGDCVGPVSAALGVNIDGDGSCGLGAGHLSSTDPLLGALAANGGPTRTHLPLAGSPAIDTADDDPCLDTDQRGVVRPQVAVLDGPAACDIGSVERTPCGTVPFVDVPLGHPFCPEITWMAEEGITRGYVDGTFRPTADVTRQAMVAFLYRLDGESLGTDPVCTVDPFPDVPASSDFCGHITWARDTGIVSGYVDGTFRPGAPVSRQALAAFLYRSAGSPLGEAPTCTSQQFTDVTLAHPFCAEIGWLVSAGLANGFDDGTFRGANPISRQAMSAFVFRFSLIADTA